MMIRGLVDNERGGISNLATKKINMWVSDNVSSSNSSLAIFWSSYIQWHSASILWRSSYDISFSPCVCGIRPSASSVSFYSSPFVLRCSCFGVRPCSSSFNARLAHPNKFGHKISAPDRFIQTGYIESHLL